MVAAPLFSPREDPDRFDLPKVTERIRSYTAAQKGRLKGRIVLIEPVRELTPPTEPASERYDDKKLADVAGSATWPRYGCSTATRGSAPASRKASARSR